MNEDLDDLPGLFDQIASEHLIQRAVRAGRRQSGRRATRRLATRAQGRLRAGANARRAATEVGA